MSHFKADPKMPGALRAISESLAIYPDIALRPMGDVYLWYNCPLFLGGYRNGK